MSKRPEDGCERLTKLLEALSPQERMILTLLHLEEKPVAEIAAATGWKVTLVKVRAFRARVNLRRALEALERKKSSARVTAIRLRVKRAHETEL